MKKSTKSLELRKARQGYGAIIASAKDTKYLLIPHSHMVQIGDETRDGSASKFLTYPRHSLDVNTVRRMFKSTKTRGKILYGWRWYRTNNTLRIGCQFFTGINYTLLRNWAIQ